MLTNTGWDDVRYAWVRCGLAIFHQHLCQMRRDVEPNRALVLDSLGIQLEG